MKISSIMQVADQELEDLRARLRATRWATRWPLTGWDSGTDPMELRRLVEYWADGFDWRTEEAKLNELPSHVATIEDSQVHYLRYEGEGPSPTPLLLTHGWPSTILEFTTLADRLSTPTRFGGRTSDAFTVIIPSLPGFGFSPQQRELPGRLPTHEIWHRLMRNELGFERYGAHGGDLGAGITSRLAQAHADALIGIHLLAVAQPAHIDETTVTAEEQEHRDALARWSAAEGAYQHLQNTRPLTLAQGLSDSPAGLLAWIVEKYRGWSDSHGDLSSTFSDDFLLTQASIYWFTNAISTSFRPYYEHHHGFVEAVRHIDVPTGLAVFPADISQPPRSWAERTYNLTRYTEMPRGGHFAAHEQPALLATELTEFFRSLRRE